MTVVDEKVITAFASHVSPKSVRESYPPLTKAQRGSILQEITDICKSGDQIKILEKAPDNHLCMALVTAWSLQSCKRSVGYYPGERQHIVAHQVN